MARKVGAFRWSRTAEQVPIGEQVTVPDTLLMPPAVAYASFQVYQVGVFAGLAGLSAATGIGEQGVPRIAQLRRGEYEARGVMSGPAHVYSKA